jgi:hypothetical protein
MTTAMPLRPGSRFQLDLRPNFIYCINPQVFIFGGRQRRSTMHTDTDTLSAGNWLQARQQVQEFADVVLGESAAFFLYRGKLYGPRSHGQYVSGLLGSIEGCETVRRLIEILDVGGTVGAVVVNEEGQEPDGSTRPVLKLSVGHLMHLWPNGRVEPV